MGANRIPDENNREQLLEYGVLTVTAPDGTKMGGKAVTLAGSNVAVKATNGATLDDWRNNTEGVLLATAARTVTTSSPDQTNYNADSIIVSFRVTAIGTGSLSIELQVKETGGGGGYFTVAKLATITTTGLYPLELSPGGSGNITAGANTVPRSSGKLPRTYRLTVIPVDASAWTYQAGNALIV